MRILIVSDNHQDEASLHDLLNIYEDIDLWLHCGDSEFNSENELWETYRTVRGNMDWETNFPVVRTIEMTDFNLVVLHGHQHQVKRSNAKMLDEARKSDAKIVFYGHTHIAKVDKEDDVYFINPGSIRHPRGNIDVGSYAIYEKIDNDEYITFYDWNHNELKDLSQKLS